MPADGHTLLRRLEPAVRPAGETAGWLARLDIEPLEESSFARLLGQARRGGIASDRLPTAPTEGEQLDLDGVPRIAKAMDLLEARGYRRAVILYGQRMFVADIASRTLESELLAHDGPAPVAVDCAVRVPTPSEERPNAVPGPPVAVGVPGAILELLEARDSHS